jgi:phosphatidylserine decarboxylase
MKHYPHPIIAREGWPFIAIAVILAAGAWWAGGWWAAPLWLVALFMMQFFRDPPRRCRRNRGRAVRRRRPRGRVEKVHDPYLDRDALKISVFMNVFNAHSNRSPVDGEVLETWYFAGEILQRRALQGIFRKRARGGSVRTADGRT